MILTQTAVGPEVHVRGILATFRILDLLATFFVSAAATLEAIVTLVRIKPDA